MKIRNIEDVKELLKLAAKVDQALPQVKAQGAKAKWPDFRLTDAEKKAIKLMTFDGKPLFRPNQKQIDIWYAVCTEWIKAFQGSKRKRDQWIVVWLKACGCRVKTIERHVSFGRTKIWYEYRQGIAQLLDFLRIGYTGEDLEGLESYHPELVKKYPRGKISGAQKINILKEWLAELEKNN